MMAFETCHMTEIHSVFQRDTCFAFTDSLTYYGFLFFQMCLCITLSCLFFYVFILFEVGVGDIPVDTINQ